MAGRSKAQLLAEFGGQGFGQSFKPALADLLIEALAPIAAEMRKYAADPAEIALANLCQALVISNGFLYVD